MRRILGLLSLMLRVAAGSVALGRLARAATAAPPVRPTITPVQSISVVIPARDESRRIGPLLERIVGAPGVTEVIVVDDESTDNTASLATSAGASVVAGRPLPDGWAGKAWAVQQGIEAASGDWVVTLDADTRPDPGLPRALVSRALGDRLDLLTVGGRFDCPTPGSRVLHAAMLTSLVYRFGPPGAAAAPDRALANGQCMTFEPAPLLAAGGMTPVCAEVVEDVAFARWMARQGAAVGFLDAGEMLQVRMFDSLSETWRGWGRSLALPGVESRNRQLLDLGVITLAQVLPLPRVLFGRGDIVDVGLLAARIGTLVGTRSAYERVDAAYWLSPVADAAAAAAIAVGIRRGGKQNWRGRSYS